MRVSFWIISIPCVQIQNLKLLSAVSNCLLTEHHVVFFGAEPRAAKDGRNRMILIITGFSPDANYDAASILEVVRRFDGNADYA
uniref:Uncharacterized protein n=1 Tax=Physcomitrium patens TaxID=3218 RepID=A0A7I4A0L8_PHYPA